MNQRSPGIKSCILKGGIKMSVKIVNLGNKHIRNYCKNNMRTQSPKKTVDHILSYRKYYDKPRAKRLSTTMIQMIKKSSLGKAEAGIAAEIRHLDAKYLSEKVKQLPECKRLPMKQE